MAEPKVIYRPCADATPESERSTLMAAYRYVIFDYHASKKGARDDAEGLRNDRTDTEIIPEKLARHFSPAGNIHRQRTTQ
jgi:hypothetical protein